MLRFNFPNITSIIIENFSLYKKAEKISIDIDKNVFCLVGANGLGKSTFITILNYALTGIVKNPERSFTWYNSVSSFYNKSKSFAASYFDGRINESDYDLAQVTVKFKIADIEYKITRGFFEPDELRAFEKKDNTGKPIDISEKYTSSELDQLYKKHFVQDSGLSEFAQFAFLQSYVFTFDETHQLLFWDSAIMERVLYLFFGLDSSTAKNADKLRKDINAYDSKFRNLQWQITQSRKELKKMLEIDEDSLTEKDNDIVEKHKELLKDFEVYQEELNSIGKELQECDLNIADLSLKISSLRAEYDEIFNQSLINDTPVEKDEELLKIVKDIKSKIFSNEPFQEYIDRLITLFKQQKEKSKYTDQEDSFKNLKKIDEKLNSHIEKQETVQKRKERFLQKEKELHITIEGINKQIKTIEEDNKNVFENISGAKSSESIALLKKSFQEQIDRYLEQKEESHTKREEARKELKKLESSMSKSFVKAEETFVPKFNSFAKSFLGLEIDIELNLNNKGANLSLRIDDGKRKDSFQLSESQRYFIDIALRMALLGIGTNEASLLIDTPEGSLDIAYESRAGKMIADFSKDKYSTIMTANINSSQLLLELAKICRYNRMHIERMTDWTYLSEVQNKENDKIESAFSTIEQLIKEDEQITGSNI